MNNKAKSIVKNLYYTVAANFATLGISILLNLFVPKLLGVTEYSYWQLYVFYSSYVGFLHFGWIDGIYLKIGGEEYENLDKKNLGSQFWYLTLLEVLISFGVILWALFVLPDGNKATILMMTAIVSIITIMKTYILYIFQSTNRIKEYAQLSRNDRYLYVLFISVYFVLGGRNFFWLITMDILSKLIMLIWGMTRVSDLLKQPVTKLKKLFPEIIDNINIGSKLMLSSIASMLIIGTIRMFVERKWTIETFGKLSFTLSISNMFLTFINAVGVVMFPLLRRTNQEKLPSLYITLRNLFVPMTYLILVFYGPARYIISLWLPEYADSLMFMGILFPMVVYEGRMSLLVNTYLKTLRQEKTILLVNIITLIVTVIVGYFIVFIVGNLTLAVVLIIFSLALRCNLAELLLGRVMESKLLKAQTLETILTAIFIIANLLLPIWQSVVVYVVAFMLYLVLTHKKLISSTKEFIQLVKN
ncbi:MAG: lipopolysaccharide biosynthesis protein [Enterococcus sp.]